MWYKINNGETLGQIGTENGRIIADEEYKRSCRITMEIEGHIAPYSITCGVYGLTFYTTFAGNKAEADSKYEGMKSELQAFIDSEDDGSDGVWCEKFTSKW